MVSISSVKSSSNWCRKCKRNFKTEKSLHDHDRKQHGQTKREYFCNKCKENRTFTAIDSLIHHLKTYHGEDADNLKELNKNNFNEVPNKGNGIFFTDLQTENNDIIS